MDLNLHDLVSFHKDDSVLYGEIIEIDLETNTYVVQANHRLYRISYENLIHKYRVSIC